MIFVFVADPSCCTHRPNNEPGSQRLRVASKRRDVDKLRVCAGVRKDALDFVGLKVHFGTDAFVGLDDTVAALDGTEAETRRPRPAVRSVELLDSPAFQLVTISVIVVF